MNDEAATGFENGQWCLLELMGHRKLAGFVREVSVGGAAMLRIDVPSGCEGFAASWCPRCGDCKCPRNQDGSALELNDLNCPLHREGSDHGEKTIATQFYGGASVYCMTPVTEAIARKLAASFRTEPVTAYDLPKRSKRLVAANVDAYDEYDDDDR